MILVIETATAACSVALIDAEGSVVASDHEEVGRGHAERLMPMIAALPGGGRADRIAVDCGPGSFTGVRVGLAAARGLGLGWAVPVDGFSSLALIAAQGMADADVDAATVAIIGGHGEYFVQRFARSPFEPLGPLRSLLPADAARDADALVIGSAAEAVVALRGSGIACDLLPRAAMFPLLPVQLAGLAASPLYGRAPDAKAAAA